MADPIKPQVKTNIDAFAARHMGQWAEFYKASSNFTGTLECTDCFADFQRARIKDVDGFGAVKAPDGKPISQILNNGEGDAAELAAKEAAKDSIAGALKLEDFDKAATDFGQELKGLKKLLSEGEHPGDVGSYLLKIKSDAVDKIKGLELAKSRINELFANNAEFKDNLKKGLRCGDAQLETIRAGMVAELDKSIKEATTKLEKALQDEANKLFVAARLQFHRLSFLGSNYERDAAMRAEMDRMIAASDKATTMEFNFSGGNDLLKNVDVSKLTVFNTVNNGWFTGASITKNGDNYSVSLNLVFETDDSARTKIASMVRRMMAEGKDTCTLKINNKDPKKAAEDARLAYEGAILAGMDPKKITIEVNGEVKYKHNDKGELVEKADLYKGHEARLQDWQKTAAKTAEFIDAQIKGGDPATGRLKQRLQEIKNAPVVEEQPDNRLGI